jgi:hypothetical protein
MCPTEQARWGIVDGFQSEQPDTLLFCGAARHPTLLGNVRKLAKIPKPMDFPVDAVRLENKGVWFFCILARPIGSFAKARRWHNRNRAPKGLTPEFFQFFALT